MVRRGAAFVAGAIVAGLLAGCSKVEIPPYLRPLSNETMMLLGKKGMTTATPMYIRVFKEESELELWKQREDGRYYHFKTYPICNWSGGLGPKIKQGDLQAPEGFYRVPQNMMNPNSQYHLAFNLGYPNAFDRVNNRTGDFLMIHGKCKSAGCYAMTDALIEEIYALARESFIGGQKLIHVDAFPFRMTAANLDRHKTNPNHKFWLTLKDGYDYFEAARVPSTVVVCDRRYVVNARTKNGQRPRADVACPQLETVVAPGAKTRAGDPPDRSDRPGPTISGLTNNGLGGNMLGFSR
jgi:murein L,D-transpeptidase YafK